MQAHKHRDTGVHASPSVNESHRKTDRLSAAPLEKIINVKLILIFTISNLNYFNILGEGNVIFIL